MLKAIIFDFDGVIVESDQPRFQALCTASSKYNVYIKPTEIKNMIGITTDKFLNLTLSDTDKKYKNKIIDDYEKNYKRNVAKYVKPIDITVDFIRNYNGPFTLAIASMSSRTVIEKLLKSFEIYERFKIITCKEDVTHHKPNPEIYLKTLDLLDLKPSECVLIEDTLIGFQAAQSAGIKCYILLNKQNKKGDFTNQKISGYIDSLNSFSSIK